MKAISTLLCCTTAALCSSITFASPLDITFYDKQTYALFDSLSDTSLDTSAPETSLQIEGKTSNETTVEHIFSAASDEFRFDMTHSLAAENSFDSVSTTILIEFTALEDAIYSLQGFYSLHASQQTLIFSRAFLFDYTSGKDLLIDSSESSNTLDETLTFAEPNDGDFDNIFSGNVIGQLFAGHDYGLELSYGLYSLESTVENSNATGEATFSITAVPEPGSLTLAFLAFGGLVFGRRKTVKACSAE